LLAALTSERYFSLLDDFERTLAELEPAADAPSLAKIARKQFSRLCRSVAALEDNPPDAALHEQRKRGKRARYTAELAGYDKLAGRAKRFQDILGDHQDAVVIQARLRALATVASTAEALAAGRLLEREHERKLRARARWPKAWKHLSKAV
jgi:CHAD domain-containing protein